MLIKPAIDLNSSLVVPSQISTMFQNGDDDMITRFVKWYLDKRRAYKKAGWNITWWDRMFLVIVITTCILLNDSYPSRLIWPIGISVAALYGLTRGFAKRRALNRHGM